MHAIGRSSPSTSPGSTSGVPARVGADHHEHAVASRSRPDRPPHPAGRRRDRGPLPFQHPVGGAQHAQRGPRGDPLEEAGGLLRRWGWRAPLGLRHRRQPHDQRRRLTPVLPGRDRSVHHERDSRRTPPSGPHACGGGGPSLSGTQSRRRAHRRDRGIIVRNVTDPSHRRGPTSPAAPRRQWLRGGQCPCLGVTRTSAQGDAYVTFARTRELIVPTTHVRGRWRSRPSLLASRRHGARPVPSGGDRTWGRHAGPSRSARMRSREPPLHATFRIRSMQGPAALRPTACWSTSDAGTSGACVRAIARSAWSKDAGPPAPCGIKHLVFVASLPKQEADHVQARSQSSPRISSRPLAFNRASRRS